MIEPNELYPKQMNGPVISAYGAALKDELSDAETIQDYLYNLSILTANETELENIGRLVGYPRPLVPQSIASENLLLLGTVPLSQDVMTGLARVGSSVGGELASLSENESGYMGLGTYRKFLDKIAILKRYGVTLQSVDQIAALVSDNYTISYNADHDIVISYAGAIGYKNIWILTQLFYRVATEPQVIIESVEEE